MSLSGITFGGLSSGIDTNSIIERLVQLEGIPISRLQRQQREIESKQNVYSQFRSRLSAFAQAAGSMNTPDAFNPVTASSSNMQVAILSGSSASSAGNYKLEVSKLAQAQKLGTTPKQDTTTALGLTAGKFVVNGKTVAVDESDSLRSIAQKVNALGVGVTASLIDGGSGNAYLTLTSGGTGAAQKIQLADVQGSVLNQLGIANGAVGVRESIANGGRSYGFSSNTETISTALKADGLGAASFSINGVTVNVDYSTDTIQGVADKINAAATGATATVTSRLKEGKTVYTLDVTGSGATPTFDDPSGFLQGLGVLQKGYGNELVVAQDAQFKLDGVSLTSATNTVTTAIPGATLTLLKANETTPETSNLTLNRDSNAIKGKIKGFADAYNELVGFIQDAGKFDAKTFQSGPLFGDSTAQQVEASISTLLFNDVPGLEGNYKNLASIGFGFDSDGKLTADDSTMNAAIAADPEAVGAVFRSTGVGSTEEIKYVSATSSTKSSGTGSFAVNITQIATKGKMTASSAQTTGNVAGEKLTFSGSLFGSTPYVLNVDVGASLSQTVSKINSDAKLKEILAARVEDGKLVVESRRYGTGGNFTVMSNLAAAADTTGVGHAGGVVVNGVDVAGTINGQEATGSGQFLTAKTDTGDASGLQIQYTGTALGSIGSVKFRKGVGVQSNDMVGVFNDSLNGVLTLADKAMSSQIETLTASITSMNERLARKQEELKQRFARMEEAISKVQAQGSRLSALNVRPSSS